MPKTTGPFLHWIIFIALALTWGSSFILMKLGMNAFSPQQVAALRISIAWLFLLPLAFTRMRREELRLWPAFFGMGLFGNLLPAFLFTAAETQISSALTGMLNALTPVFTLIVGLLVFRLRVKPAQVIGLFIGLGGAVGLLLVRSSDNANGTWIGGLLVALATLFYGISVNIIRAKLGTVNPVTATLWALSFIGPIALSYLFTTDFVHVMQTSGKAWSSLGFVSILGVFGTALSVIVYNILIRDAGPLFAASVTYLIPVVAMLWGLQIGEEILWWHLLFIIVILSGIRLISRK